MQRLIEEARTILLGEGLSSGQVKDVLWKLGKKFKYELDGMIRQHFRKSDTTAVGASSRQHGNKVSVYVGPIYNPNRRELESFVTDFKSKLTDWGWEGKVWSEVEDDIGEVDVLVTGMRPVGEAKVRFEPDYDQGMGGGSSHGRRTAMKPSEARSWFVKVDGKHVATLFVDKPEGRRVWSYVGPVRDTDGEVEREIGSLSKAKAYAKKQLA